MKLKELLPIIPLKHDFLKMFKLTVAADGLIVASTTTCYATVKPTPAYVLEHALGQAADKQSMTVLEFTMSSDPVGTARYAIHDPDLNVLALVLADLPMFSGKEAWELNFYWIGQPRGLIE